MKRPNNTRRRFLAPWSRKAVEVPDPDSPGAEAPRSDLMKALHDKPAIYHCISRVVDRQMVLGAEEKEKFTEYMRIYEQFCQVRILTYCVMSNHFHILLEVPQPPEDRGKSWSDEKFLKHVSCLYEGPEYFEIAATLREYRREGWDNLAEEHRNQYFDRMWDLSQFMKTLKQRFVQWFNKRHHRSGAFWSERFKSLLVESGHAARVVAAYIDLNPVRAGIVGDPGDYRWSGYGEAMLGYRRAKEGIWLLALSEIADHHGDEWAVEEAAKWGDALRHYRKLLYMEGEEDENDRRKNRAGIAAERVARVLAMDGGGSAGGGGGGSGGRSGNRSAEKLTEAEMLRCRVRWFADGGAIGSEEFVNSVLGMACGFFGSGRRRGRGGRVARKITGVSTALHSLRGLGKGSITITA